MGLEVETPLARGAAMPGEPPLPGIHRPHRLGHRMSGWVRRLRRQLAGLGGTRAAVAGERRDLTAAPSAGAGFGLFVTGTLFVRPSEIVPALSTIPVYELLIVLCVAVSGRQLLSQLRWQSLTTRPITLCALGMLVAIVLSNLMQFSLYEVKEGGSAFVKVLLYYLLLVGLVDTPHRLRRLLTWIVVFTLILVVLALLQYHQVINISALEAMRERRLDIGDDIDGEDALIARLVSTGIYHDPNDLCVIVAIAALICVSRLADRRGSAARFFWVVPLAVFGWAIKLTYSRGGLIALLSGFLVLVHARLGTRKTMLCVAILGPALLLLFGGRQTTIDLSNPEDTSQGRIQLWNDGLSFFRSAPLFGIGQGHFAEESGGLVAHNSFVHCYAEVGFLGGTLFFGAFYLALRTIHKLGDKRLEHVDEDIAQLRVYMMAIVTCYTTGLMSLSRPYTVPTYMLLALAAAFIRIASYRVPAIRVRADGKLARSVVLASFGALLMLHVFVRLLFRKA
jgi:hypothetical protein